jgi:glutaredoxin
MIKIVEITSPGCSHCAAAKKILEGDIRTQFPDVDIQYIDVLTPEGQKLVGEFGIMSSPGVLVNGELFAVGGLDKNKLIAKIKELKG